MRVMQIRDKTQKRLSRFENIEFRVIQGEDGKKKVRGYPILFNTSTVIYGDWREVIAPTALDGVDLSQLRLLVDHNSGMLLARAGINLRTEIDSVGLFIEAELPNTTLANDTYELVSKGIQDGMSFAFWVEEMTTNWEEKIDTITKFKEVPEVSIVTFPAYPQTVIIASEPDDEIDSVEVKKDSKKEALIKLIQSL